MEKQEAKPTHYKTASRDAPTAVLSVSDPRCDVILEVSGNEGRLDLCVSSEALSLASPVFSTMFSSGFKEGIQQNKEREHLRVPLPEDNGDVMLIICLICHHRGDELRDEYEARKVLDLAYASEKYSFTDALRPWSSIWLNASLGEHPQDDRSRLLGAACMFDNWKEFSRISFDIICHHTGPILQYPSPAAVCLPGSAKGKYTYQLCIAAADFWIAYLEIRRLDIVIRVVEVLERAVSELFSAKAISTSGSHSGSAWVRQLEEYQLWPIGTRVRYDSVSALLDRMKRFREPWSALESGNAQTYREPYYNVRVKLSDLREELLSNRMGICLDCTQTNGESAVRGECRLKEHIPK
jgi:hypothetical protein